jgi:anti-sigma factor RsiW
MTDATGPIGEEELQAWVDGRLSRERAEAVEAYLRSQPGERLRLSEYADQNQTLRAAFVEGAPALPERLRVSRLIARRHERRFRLLNRIAAAIVFLMIGGIGGWNAREITNSFGWATATEGRLLTADAVAAHSTFAPEVRHPVEVPAAQQAHLHQWLSNRLGRPLIIPDLSGVGLQLTGGRVLPSEGGPAAQLMYEEPNGDRLTIYVRVGLSGETRLYRATEKLGTFLWIDEGFGCVIVGRADRNFLARVADSVYEQILPDAPKGDAPSRGKES